MVSEPVQIVSFDVRAQAEGRTLYRLTDTSGQRYATQNAWMASLCKTAYEKGQHVILWSSGGWYYKDLTEVRLVDENEPVTP